MRRLVLTACVAGFAMAGHLPVATAADDAGTATESGSANSKTGKSAAKSTTPIKLAHVRSDAIKELAARSAVTKAAREVEAIEAVSGADTQPQPTEANASAQPADINAASSGDAAEARPVEAAKAAAPKHMNTGHPHIDALVALHAAANNVPEALVHRVIVRESKYQKDLVGGCGCIGLMQIKLGTARGLGYTGDAQGLHDPNTNLTYGVKYLAGAYRAAHGDHDRAVLYFAKGYYEEAKRQRLADAGSFDRPERLRPPLDITPKIAGGRHARAH